MRFIWRIAWPILVYEWLRNTVMLTFGSAMKLSVLEITLISALICIPVFGIIYRKDRERQLMSIEKCVPAEAYYMVWAVSGTAALAFLSSQLVSMTGLMEWSKSFQEVNNAIAGDSLWLQLLTAVFIAPAAEEFLMRGVLYGRLREGMSAKAAILCSGLLFGIFHGNIVQGIHAFVVGVFLAWLMERFRDIRVPILGHMAANLSSFVVTVPESGTEYILELVVCLACVGRTIQILKMRES